MAWLFYVALTGGSLSLAWLGLEQGWSHLATALGIGAGVAVLVAALERALPYRPDWLRSHGDLRTDVLHVLVSTGLALGGRWFSALAFGEVRSEANVSAAWPTGLPVAIQVVLALLVTELAGYWVHRAQHEIPALWRLHSIHHSAPRLYWLNQMRSHPLDAIISGLAVVPAVVLGAPEPVLALLAALTSAHLTLQHSNIEIRLGPLNWLLSMSEVHRWHHSVRPDEANRNYGGVLLLWDVLFRTRLFPRERRAPAATGVSMSGFPTGYLAQLASPLSKRLWAHR